MATTPESKKETGHSAAQDAAAPRPPFVQPFTALGESVDGGTSTSSPVSWGAFPSLDRPRLPMEAPARPVLLPLDPPPYMRVLDNFFLPRIPQLDQDGNGNSSDKMSGGHHRLRRILAKALPQRLRRVTSEFKQWRQEKAATVHANMMEMGAGDFKYRVILGREDPSPNANWRSTHVMDVKDMLDPSWLQGGPGGYTWIWESHKLPEEFWQGELTPVRIYLGLQTEHHLVDVSRPLW